MEQAKITVRIIQYEKEIILKAEKGTKLSEILRKEGISHSYPCGGNARCGKCRVLFKSGAPAANSFDKRLLSAHEIELGVRLSCRAVLNDDCTLDVSDGEREMDILGTDKENGEEIKDLAGYDMADFYGIAIDLGTTTIASALIVKTGEETRIVKSVSRVNHQRSYGSDVISRISAAEDSKAFEDMKKLVREDISGLIKELMPAGCENLKTITIAGNTTMLHLLTGKDVSGLGRYPYTPVSLELEKMWADSLFEGCGDAVVTLLPGISAFVGADIVAGLFSLDINGNEKIFFLDLGTNGEMAFYDGKRFRVASAAAGPVFEAGGISCGVPSISGAISHVSITAGHDFKAVKTTYETIGKKPPVGICGTGVLELVSELARCGLIDETGLLRDEYFEEGFPVTGDRAIRVTEDDIRSVQMGKAAIFTAVKALLEEDLPDRIYIAGGFGSSVEAAKISNLKMFPSEFSGKMVSVGNASLKGAADFTAAALSGEDKEKEAVNRLKGILEKATVKSLSELDGFDEDYIDAMNF